jgi:NAD(P)-dependent dehydrogenase (short-subunit alcohol dehydrogenase family)
MTTMTGKVTVVTGANQGIGYATAAGLARAGAEVILLCRSREKGEAARQTIMRETGNARLHLIVTDLSSLAETRRAAADIANRWARLDVLVNNAGVVMPQRTLTADGLETQFATNHLSYFILGNLLLPLLRASGAGRLINVSSSLHEKGVIDFDNLQAERHYDGMPARPGWGQYCHTKLMNVLFSYELARRLPDTRVTVNALHPGQIATGLVRHTPAIFQFFYKRIMPGPEEGARTSLHLATAPEAAGQTGKYWVDCQPVASSPASHDAAAAARLWDVSVRLTGITSPADIPA